MTPAKICLLVLMLIPVSAFAQLKGKYITGYNPYGGSTISILDSINFSYSAGYCGEETEGNGYYTKSKHKLILYFVADTPNKVKIPIEIKAIQTNSDTIKISFSLYDERDSTTVPFATILLKDNHGVLKDGIKTNYNGQGILTYHKSMDSINIYISAFPFNSVTCSVAANKDYNIKVHLTREIHYITNHTWKFKVFKKKGIPYKLISIQKKQKHYTYPIYYRK